MMGQSSETPSTPMKAVVAIAVAGLVVLGIGPLAVILGCGYGLVLAVLVAYALANVGGLEQARFAYAQPLAWISVGALLGLVLLARRLTRTPESALGKGVSFATRRPLVLISCLLLTAGMVAVKLAWARACDIATVVLLADLDFFGLGGLAIGLFACGYVALSVYRWSVASRYRAGIGTGVMATLLAPLIVVGALGQALPVSRHTVAYDAAQNAEERTMLLHLYEIVEHGGAPAPLPKGTDLAATSEADSKPVDDCFAQLSGDEEDKVTALIERDFRLSPEDARDVVRDAMLKVCVRQARKAYENLGAALTTAARNRARSPRRIRLTECALDIEIPLCVAPSEPLLFRREQEVLNAALCTLPSRRRAIIEMHFFDEMSYPEIAATLGITAREAKDDGTNGIKQLRRAHANACPL